MPNNMPIFTMPTLVMDEGCDSPANIDYTSESESVLPMYFHSMNSNDIAEGDVCPASPPIVDIYMPPAQETDATNQQAKQHEHQSMHVDEIYMPPRQEIAATKKRESECMHVDERPKTNKNRTIPRTRTSTSTAAASSTATSKCGSPTMAPPPPHFSKCCSAVKPVVHPALPLQSL